MSSVLAPQPTQPPLHLTNLLFTPDPSFPPRPPPITHHLSPPLPSLSTFNGEKFNSGIPEARQRMSIRNNKIKSLQKPKHAPTDSDDREPRGTMKKSSNPCLSENDINLLGFCAVSLYLCMFLSVVPERGPASSVASSDVLIQVSVSVSVSVSVRRTFT